MEDDLKKYGKRPQKMEDDLKKYGRRPRKMEDGLLKKEKGEKRRTQKK
jgi:hypothetical protein